MKIFDNKEFASLILNLRQEYLLGNNLIDYAKNNFNLKENHPLITQISYDLQAGTYIENFLKNEASYISWYKQLANILSPYINESSSILEVGCGEATTLVGILKELNRPIKNIFGFDFSWSRCARGVDWLNSNSLLAEVFVADIFNIPFGNSTIDVVYTCHSLEPNFGRERDALIELLRIAKHAVVIIEPIYELASTEAKVRMASHGYIRNLKKTLDFLNVEVKKYELLEFTLNQLNPSGLILIEKKGCISEVESTVNWRCPLSHTKLIKFNSEFYSSEAGVAYPSLKNIPLLIDDYAILASSYEKI